MVVSTYYQSEWMKENELDIDILKGLNLEEVYKNLIKQLIPIKNTLEDDIEKLMELDRKRENLEKEIKKLEKRMNKERQFNRKVELNIELQKKQKELEQFLQRNNLYSSKF